MKKLLLVSLLLPFTVSADMIRCEFTEPFINTTYSMAQQSLTYAEATAPIKVIKNVSFQIKAAGVFELVGKDGKVLQTLKLNGKGSDGMSDTIYPYDVKDTLISGGGANGGFGGCSSNFLKNKTGQN